MVNKTPYARTHYQIYEQKTSTENSLMKNEQKHTPGPWKLNFPQHRIEDSYGCEIVPAPWGTLTDEANADLIAAAPDLLEALLAAQRAFSCLQPLEFATLAEKARSMVDAAIQKATGEKPSLSITENGTKRCH